jgi:hypothetical protein
MIRLVITTQNADGTRSVVRLQDAVVPLLLLEVTMDGTATGALTPAQAHKLANALREWANIYEPQQEYQQQTKRISELAHALHEVWEHAQERSWSHADYAGFVDSVLLVDRYR